MITGRMLMFSHQTNMTLSATEECNIGAFHSHVNLGNPNKEKENKKLYSSEPFMKPLMSLKERLKTQILSGFKWKKLQGDATFSNVESKQIISLGREQYREYQVLLCLRKKKIVVQQEEELRTEGQILWTDIKQILPQKNKSELSLSKQCIRSEQLRSEKAGGLPIPKSVWESFTRPSAKVILDLNTANPTLKLSDDGRSLRTKTYKEYHSSQNEYQTKHKHQYNSWMCVQAQEGYSTGKHYWEVDVKGKCDWRIGVVKESAQRNGFIKLNTETGYWTLRLQLGSLVALTEPVTKLNQAPPSKVGVHLDLEEGHVSFYDAKKRKRIYRFNADFRKCVKMYPVFGTVETDKPLKII